MILDKYLLLERGLNIEQCTSPNLINSLIQKLYPVKTEFELIRLGSDHDGGYLIPDDLNNIAACFSPGVDVNASFEKDLFIKKGIQSHLADYSVDSPPMNFVPKSFTKKYLGAFDNDKYMSLDYWINNSGESPDSGDFLLQMDIEGGEYSSFLRASEEIINRFRIIIVEIHNVEGWANKKFFDLVDIFFTKLLKNFYVVHNHPNNCCGLVNIGGILLPHVFELTLLRKDRSVKQDFCNFFPHPLDRPNVTYKPDLALPQNWYAKPDDISIDFLNDVSGVIHIGANNGQERDFYARLNLDVIWIEAIPEIFQHLKKNIQNYNRQIAYNYLITDLDNVEYLFNVSNNNGESSSILRMSDHKKMWPDVNFSSSIKLISKTFFSFVSEKKIPLEKYQGLILDTQGSELLILKGCNNLLNNFKYIKIEVADFEAYFDCPSPEEISNYLSSFGFVEINRSVLFSKSEVGTYYNVIYQKKV